MKRILLTFILFFIVFNSNAQIEDAWVYFKDKPNASGYIENPLSILSQRALDRRSRQNIVVDVVDVPINLEYASQVKASSGIVIEAKSKWLNAMHVKGTQEAIQNLSQLDFVLKIDFANKSLNTGGKPEVGKPQLQTTDKLEFSSDFVYGVAANQIEMLGGHVLHENDFTGEGMQIAVIDAGFPNVDTHNAFKRLRDNGQLLGGYDFVNRSENFYTGHYHGMAVLSTIGGYVEEQFVGTAPDASFYLFISEDSTKETPLEESLWVEAAEKADSLGVDVINTSLGYSTFDNPTHNYSYADMNGMTTFISRGAEIAFSRGMIIVNSAGNEGNDPWHYITAPADASSVLSVGAVNPNGDLANFSSYGPTSDGRIKPDVLAEGAGVFIIRSSGEIGTSNGTSFSSPVLTGVIACLWQAYPEKTNAEIVQLIKESGHLYVSPTSQGGYGIPNFGAIHDALKIELPNSENQTVVFPNPTDNELYIRFPEGVQSMKLEIFTATGKRVLNKNVEINNAEVSIKTLTPGVYFLKLGYNNETESFKIIKV